MHRFPERQSPEAARGLPSASSAPGLAVGRGRAWASAPAEWDVARPVASLLHKWFVELSSSTRVNARPAVFTVILQAGHVGTEERSKLPTAASALTFVTHLVIKHIWLHFHLQKKGKSTTLKH